MAASMAAIRWLVVVAWCAWAASAAHAADAVWDALRAPGSVVVLRHSYAPGGFDPPDARPDDCSTQRNLDENGRAQAVRIGEAFRQNGLTVGTVLSSPTESDASARASSPLNTSNQSCRSNRTGMM